MALSKEADWLKERISCAMCLEIFDRPHTLVCLHTLCKGCIEDLRLVNKESNPGYVCPLCEQFSPKDSVRHNFLINELLEFYEMITTKKDSRICKQCKTNTPTHHCVDCKVDMCENCKSVHDSWELMAAHNSISLTDMEQGIIIDRHIFCPKHKNKLIELNCITCEKPICVICKAIDHDGHKCESTEDALTRLLPSIGETRDKIERDIKHTESVTSSLTTKANAFRKDIDALEKQAREIHKKHQQKLDNDLDTLITRLNAARDEIRKQEKRGTDHVEKHISDTKHVIKCVDTAIATAQGTSLLQELQSGIKTKLHETEKDIERKRERLSAATNIQDPSLKLVPRSCDDENMIGTLATKSMIKATQARPNARPKKTICKSKTKQEAHDSLMLTTKTDHAAINYPNKNVHGHETKMPSKLWPFRFQTFQEKACKKSSSIELQHYVPHTFTVISDKLWIPVNINPNSGIMIYTKDGIHEKTMNLPQEIKTPRAVAECQTNAHTVVAVASGSGLFIISLDGKLIETLHGGEFSDVCTYNEHIYAYEYNTFCILVFQHDTNTWSPSRTIQCKGTSCSLSSPNTLLVAQNHIYIYDINSDTVTKYSMDGLQLGKYGREGLGAAARQLYGGRLCGCDDMGNLLVCDEGNERLQCLSAHGKWSIVMDNLDFQPRYAVSLSDHSFCILDLDKTVHFYKLT